MPSPSQSDYSFILLGDTHYDADPPSTYHADYDEKEEWLSRVQRAEFDRNAKLWAGPGLRLLQSAGALVRPDTRFVLQMGDLIQGDCRDAIVRYWFADGAGASLVRVRDDGVSVEFHGGDSPTATKTFQLR